MKLGVVVEGGGARSNFAVGVMDILMKEGIYADYIIGSGKGIANALSYASKQYGRSYQIAVHHSYRTHYCGVKHLLNPTNRCFYNLDFIFNIMPNERNPFDFEEYKASGCQVYAAVTNVETGKAEYLPIDYDNGGDKVILASWAEPLGFPKVVIDGKRYMDGAYAEPISYKKALEACDKVIVITTREKRYEKLSKKGVCLSRWRMRKYPEFVKLIKNRDEIYSQCTDELHRLEEERRVFVIRPDSTVGWKEVEYDPNQIRRMYRRGYNNAKQVIEQIKNYIES